MPRKDPFLNRVDTLTHAKGRSGSSGQFRDLCSNCDNGDECGGRTRPRRPIFFCEQFEVFGAVLASDGDRAVPEQPVETRSANGDTGLCVNCDNAGTCVSPKPEGGVWHCEEYR